MENFMENKKQEEIKIISKHEFYFETPIYDVVQNNELEDNILFGNVDAFSAKNGFETTYQIYFEKMDEKYHSKGYFHNFYKTVLTCKRRENDILRFFIYKDNEVTIKFGQCPSLADIQFSEIDKKYNGILPYKDMAEFKRAIGLVSHGIGVGSFVYLRRIFENLIYNTFNNYKQSISVNKEDFLKKRIEEKIEILKEYLPSQLIEMKSVYAILSKGIHELEEEECLRYFPALKLSIELILDQKIEMEIKRKKDIEVKKQIQAINQELAK